MLIAVGVLVGVANLGAYAATGKPLILGKKNFAPQTTTLGSRADGATLRLLNDGEGAPLAVQRDSRKVRFLNVDMLDGASASELKTKGYLVRLGPTTETTRVAYNLPDSLGYSGVFASYSVLVETTGDSVFCAWEGPQFGRGNGVLSADGRFTVTGTAIVNGDVDPRFYCETQPGETITIVAGSSISALELHDGRDVTVEPLDLAIGGFPFRR